MGVFAEFEREIVRERTVAAWLVREQLVFGSAGPKYRTSSSGASEPCARQGRASSPPVASSGLGPPWGSASFVRCRVQGGCSNWSLQASGLNSQLIHLLDCRRALFTLHRAHIMHRG